MSQRKRSARRRKKKQNAKVYIGMTFLVLVVIAAAVLLLPRLFEMDSIIVSGEQGVFRFPKGITIAQINVTGMTKEEARERLETCEEEMRAAYGVTVDYEGERLVLDAADFSVEYDTEEILETAVAHCKRAQQNKVDAARAFMLTPVFSYEGAEERLQSFQQKIDREAVEPEVTDFDFSALTFSFAEGKPGVALDYELLLEKVKTIVEKEKSGQVTATVHSIEPVYQVEELRERMALLASHSTDSENNENGNSNMRKALQLINETVIGPGEVFSFHTIVGDSMDPALGWLPAGAWRDSKLVYDEYGGGICQASTTVYGCAIRANMQVLERYNHLQPSSYAPDGLDATVDYPSADLRLQNVTDYPIYIVAGMIDTQLTVTMYGYLSPDFAYIEPYSEVTSETPIPKAIEEKDETLKPGEKTLVRPGYSGKQTIAWRVFYDAGGNELWREDLPSSYYGEVAPIYKVGPEKKKTEEEKEQQGESEDSSAESGSSETGEYPSGTESEMETGVSRHEET